MWKSCKAFLLGTSFLLALQFVVSKNQFTTDCCLLPKEELETLAKSSNHCPSADKETLPSPCSLCKSGKCRIRSDECVCPEVFLESSRLYYTECERRFTKPWPSSVGAEDAAISTCTSPPPTRTISSEDPSPDCCLLSEQELQQRWSLADDCPGPGFQILDELCEACKPGKCRVRRNECFCPDRFLSSSRLYYTDCEKRFGKPWPSSVGAEDRTVESCKNNDSTPSTTPSPVSPETNDPGQGQSLWIWLGPALAAIIVPVIAWALNRFCNGNDQKDESQ